MRTLKTTAAVMGLLAFTAHANAQSSVTIFGVLDMSASRIQSSGTGSRTGLANGGSSPSRLGFRGIEDLGGGLSAGFWMEGAVEGDTGSAAGFSLQRRSTVSLYSPYGEVRLGRDMVPTYFNLLGFDPFAVRGIGQFQGYNNFGFSTLRASNAVSYFLPKDLGGFHGQLQYAFGEKASNVRNDKQGDSYGARVGYANGPIDIAFGYNAWKQVIGASDVPPVAIGRDVQVANLGVSYDFGILKLNGIYGREEVKGAVASNSRVDSMLLGVIVPVGLGDFKASVSKYNLRNSANDFSKFSVGYQYRLSKRTTVYASIAQLRNDGAATRSITLDGLATVVPRAGGESTGFDFGIRHVF